MPPPPGSRPSMPVVVEELAERESDVLRYVALMFSTAEIAAEMCISVNTVKSYLKNIFRKFAVTSRSEAVRRARQLEFLSSR